MKTVTEFSGFVLAEALKKVEELTPKPAKIKPRDTRLQKPEKPAGAESPAAEGEKKTADDVPVAPEAAPAPIASETAVHAAPSVDISAAIGEAFKLEGDKLAMFMNAIDVAKRRPRHIKRVVVLAPGEGEKAPEGATEKDGNVYLLEHFFVPQPRREDRRGGGKRFGKGGKGRGGRAGRGGRDRDRGGRGPGGGDRPGKRGGGGPSAKQKPKPNVAPAVKPNVTPAAAPKTEDALKAEEAAKP